jgi:hypothetical protein
MELSCEEANPWIDRLKDPRALKAVARREGRAASASGQAPAMSSSVRPRDGL